MLNSGHAAWNPLLAHALDVAAVTLQLWDRYLAPNLRSRLTEAFGAGEEATARAVVAFLAALHDIGKTAPCFLHQFQPDRFTPAHLRARIRDARTAWEEAARKEGLPLPEDWAHLPRARHEHISAAVLPRLLGCTCPVLDGEMCTDLDHEGLYQAAYSLGGHHGHIPGPDTVGKAHSATGGPPWDPIRTALVDAVAELLGIDRTRLTTLIYPEQPSALITFTGLVVLADWIGSDETRFPYRPLTTAPAQWWKAAQRNAQDAITALRLDRWQPTDATWEELWPGTTPRPFQQDAMRLMPEHGPALVIVESDTGSGKTRLALWCAHYLARHTGYQGLYMAMPTRAATNQVAEEIERFMKTAVNSDAANLAVVHGTASATDMVHRLVDAARPPAPHDGTGTAVDDLAASVETSTTCATHADEHNEPGRALLNPWYLRRCLGLIATFGIGTIDQLVLGAQRSRHWFLRMLGLASKTVIIDEAHAYELYQQDLLGAAVEWLADAGASVVVLSATLPESVRAALTTAWCTGRRTVPADQGESGPITVVDGGGRIRRGGPVPEQTPALDTTVQLQPDPGPQELATQLLDQARDGGCIGVVRTRVASAVALYDAARAQATAAGWSPDEILLLHGRLMPRDRQPIEERLTHLLGPAEDRAHRNPDRPHRLLVIATQVIEQSLDLDFDHLVTDLAPIDLLIQRRGREHRHTVNDPHRSAWCAHPVLRVLYVPDSAHPGLPLVEPPGKDRAGNADGFVYAPYVLAATYRGLQKYRGEDGRICITTPRHSVPLLQSVYGAQQTAHGAWGALLERTGHDWGKELGNERDEARGRMVRPYAGERSVPVTALDLASGRLHGDGDEGGVQGLRAVSRLGDPSVTAVCLYRQTDGTLTYDADGKLPADLQSHRPNTAARRQQQRDLLLNTVTLPATWFRGKRGLPAPELWPALPHPALRRIHALLLAPSGRCTSGPVGRITYHQVTGLTKR